MARLTALRGAAPALWLLIVMLGAALAFGSLDSTPASAAPRSATGGTASWGVKESFRNYIVGPIAHGAIETGGGASGGPGGFTFGIANGSHDSGTGATSATFAGSVHFTGHVDNFNAFAITIVVRTEWPRHHQS